MAVSEIPILGMGGKVLRVRSLSLLDRAYFRLLHAKAVEVAGDRSIADVYDNDLAFKGLVDAALILCGIATSCIDLQTMIALLFGVGDIPAILLDLNFPAASTDTSSKGDDLPSEDLSSYDPDAWAIATIWAATDDPVKALAIANAPLWVFTSEVMRCRSKQVQMADPEYGKRQTRERSRDNFKRMIETPGALEKLKSAFDDPNNVIPFDKIT